MSEKGPQAVYSPAHKEWPRVGQLFHGRAVVEILESENDILVLCDVGNGKRALFLTIPRASATLEWLPPYTGVME